MSDHLGLTHVPLAQTPLTRKDFSSGQEVRWCPGCGDYAILAAVQGLLPELGVARENMVVISGIGCSSRFPYYMNTYGMHSIHGRAPTIATGLAITRPDLAVMVMTGDGDALSIGGNHLIHALRRNVNITIVLFNNRIYGLTKGQYSPTSERGKVTPSSPQGSADAPLNPIALAIGAQATFVARTVDSDRSHMTRTLRAAIEHRGASLVEIYQNCPIFNDGAFDDLVSPENDGLILLEHGEPIMTAGKRFALTTDKGSYALAPADQVEDSAVVTHDATRDDPTFAFALAQLTDAGKIQHAPIGIFRDVTASSYDDLARSAGSTAIGDNGLDAASLQAAFRGADTWVVS